MGQISNYSVVIRYRTRCLSLGLCDRHEHITSVSGGLNEMMPIIGTDVCRIRNAQDGIGVIAYFLRARRRFECSARSLQLV